MNASLSPQGAIGGIPHPFDRWDAAILWNADGVLQVRYDVTPDAARQAALVAGQTAFSSQIPAAGSQDGGPPTAVAPWDCLVTLDTRDGSRFGAWEAFGAERLALEALVGLLPSHAPGWPFMLARYPVESCPDGADAFEIGADGLTFRSRGKEPIVLDWRRALPYVAADGPLSAVARRLTTASDGR